MKIDISYFEMGLLIVSGLYFLTVAADWLVTGASSLARRLGVSPLVVGLTVVALGTSMPELVVSIDASLRGNPGIAVGNVVGSNMFNSAMILGIAAIICPIACSRAVVRRDVPIMIGVTLVFWYMARDGLLSRPESIILLVLLVVYTVFSYLQEKQSPAADEIETTPAAVNPIPGADLPAAALTSSAASVTADVAAVPVTTPTAPIPGSEAPDKTPQPESAAHPVAVPVAAVATPIVTPVATETIEEGHVLAVSSSIKKDLGLIILGMIGLVGGSKLLLLGSISAAKIVGMSDEIIGLTLIAAGTSMPELATSVVAAWEGQSDIAIGNVVGSNMLNIMGIIGVGGSILPLEVSPHMIGIDIPLMAVVTMGCLPIMRTDFQISRLEGIFLVTVYIAYTYVLMVT
jgi:cation:H+ antiporter